ncbi:MAG: hypothetical protein IT457_22150 [Planctomycetes bacterium]|nr:hypothetical protein [Planctomycetota bacterium]
MPGYRPQSEDTSEAVDRQVCAGLAALSPAERLRLAMDAWHAMVALSIAGLRSQYPDASEDELRCRAGARRLGPELTLRVFGERARAWLD